MGVCVLWYFLGGVSVVCYCCNSYIKLYKNDITCILTDLIFNNTSDAQPYLTKTNMTDLALPLCLLVSSADKLCILFGPRTCLT